MELQTLDGDLHRHLEQCKNKTVIDTQAGDTDLHQLCVLSCLSCLDRRPQMAEVRIASSTPEDCCGDGCKYPHLGN